jgi:hypothetical protein
MATTATVIPIAKICQYLAASDQQEQSLLKSRFLRGNLSRAIYMVRNSVEWLNEVSPTSQELTLQTNYLYWLCQPYIGEAKYILNQGGSGQIVNPATGLASSIGEVFYQITVDVSGAPPLTNGDIHVVIPDEFIMVNSLQVTVDSVVLPYGAYTDRMSYTVNYTNANATINFFNGGINPPENIGVQSGQIIQIRGQKFVTI